MLEKNRLLWIENLLVGSGPSARVPSTPAAALPFGPPDYVTWPRTPLSSKTPLSVFPAEHDCCQQAASALNTAR